MLGRRISVHGTSGSGKSTLASALAEGLGLPRLELDAVYHLPNRQDCPPERFRKEVREFLDTHDAWVIEGNYSKVREMIHAEADTIVWLDYPLPIVLWRLTRRTFRMGIRREELWNGNRESLWRHLFTRESLYLWVLKTYRKRRSDAREAFADPANAGKALILLRHPREAQALLRGL